MILSISEFVPIFSPLTLCQCHLQLFIRHILDWRWICWREWCEEFCLTVCTSTFPLKKIHKLLPLSVNEYKLLPPGGIEGFPLTEVHNVQDSWLFAVVFCGVFKCRFLAKSQSTSGNIAVGHSFFDTSSLMLVRCLGRWLGVPSRLITEYLGHFNQMAEKKLDTVWLHSSRVIRHFELSDSVKVLTYCC